MARSPIQGGLAGSVRRGLAGPVQRGLSTLAQRVATPPIPVPTLADTITARQRFFGVDAVDADTGAARSDQVILSWFGCASFAVALGGSVFLLDAWVPRGATSGYVPTTPAEVAALRPAAIFIGHGHFDHAADAGPIAQASGAVVHGTAEHCATARKQVPGTPEFRCVELGSSASLPGDRYDFELAPGVSVTAIRHIHSARTSRYEGADACDPVKPTPALRDIRSYPPSLADTAHLLRRLTDPEGGVLLYQFRTDTFTLTWHDSSGPLSDKAPRVVEVLRTLPESDVHVGAVQGYNQFTNGLRDPRTYIEALRPKVFVPNHHDNWLPLITARGEAFRAPMEAELSRMTTVPELRMLLDPTDYIVPGRLSFPAK
ncbi:MBL fold metallo-hydrolase [Nocardia sp. NBC_01503]|uniref:MBL fold metallo-hydrolase n=1 Tax=Nocardia sp. NBC_01503 TaxID=2975997 RepID=UPI002E7C2AA7|nr:MBL fold metallo-hydrolase [Nocardia sp. NBC_01503]WTL32942.1 MBL fold metallo-hydrolase [Nocardia sp. NBC_01503]